MTDTTALQQLRGCLPADPGDHGPVGVPSDAIRAVLALVVVLQARNDTLEVLSGDRYPVTWVDEDDKTRYTWSRNRFTGELEPDPDGHPLYTTARTEDAE